MHAGQVYDDAEAVIMAVNETPQYRDEIIDEFIDQILRRRKRRFSTWRTTLILLAVGALGTLFVDRLVSFPLSLFALAFLWITIVAVWAAVRLIAILDRHVTRFALMGLLARTAARRGVSGSVLAWLALAVAKTWLKRFVGRYLD
ncbi:MAG TPA: hypothetical protein VEG65_02960 [Candidatus Bathyarchaeia archaeon]|nr:hypothetical protein [Candidatus Bathyarchaeia archaeon]